MTTQSKRGRSNIHAVVDSLNLKPAMIAPHYNGLVSSLQEFADADYGLEEAAWEIRKHEIVQAYGYARSDSEKSFPFSNGVAIIPVHGVLLNRFSHSWGYATGYNFIRAQYKAAQVDDDVRLIVFDCNSYGGVVSGCFETASSIFKGRSKKPTLAVVDANCYSACYAIASAADKIAVTPSGGAGSIGVVAMHLDLSQLLNNMGIKVTFIHAGKHKIDGNPFQELPEDVRESLQASINKDYDKFVGLVAQNRNLSTQTVKDTEARCYDADEALSVGLIDAVQTPGEAVAAYLDGLSGSEHQQEFAMTTQTNAPGTENPTTPAVNVEEVEKTARTAERDRISAIMGCDEAKDKTKLANHLALNTEMSVDEAKAILGAAAPEAIKDEGAGATSANSAFATFMNADGHPNVGAGSENAEEPSTASRILAAQAAATGRKLAIQ